MGIGGEMISVMKVIRGKVMNVFLAGRDPVGAGQHRVVPSGRRVVYATKCVQHATECIPDARRQYECVQDVNECAQDATMCVHDDAGIDDERNSCRTRSGRCWTTFRVL